MRGYRVSISPFAPTEQLVTGFRPAQQRLVDRIVAEDGVVLETYGQRPIRDEQYTLRDGTYYRIDYQQTGSESVPAKTADLSWENGREAPEDETVLTYADLPAVDQHALEYLVLGPEYSREGLPEQGLGVGDSPAPYPQGTADSELVGAGTTWVEWDGRAYRVTISTEDRTNTRRTFDYTATRVADSTESFSAYVTDRYLTVLEDLSTEERTVLEAAIDAGEDGDYEDCNEPSPGYEQLRERMDSISDLPDPATNHWYVSYEGERYLLELYSLTRS
ncbi:hypothetical protein SAMN05216559_1906 [Halomicrobium zhouii]|uniref:DUF7979 domain-containing protein n=1 Tax=Halomicrobium zhouii TaxID=767519 RepID=A0A1I6L2Q2_9EURY|nr:hypothetical protein [Halomicrobium zhouii]SFR97744.1 hypothetical protein SAMN05216559_1906 [Halomicrobium zhouii]